MVPKSAEKTGAEGMTPAGSSSAVVDRSSDSPASTSSYGTAGDDGAAYRDAENAAGTLLPAGSSLFRDSRLQDDSAQNTPEAGCVSDRSSSQWPAIVVVTSRSSKQQRWRNIFTLLAGSFNG